MRTSSIFNTQNVATRWSDARNMLLPTMLGYVAFKCCDRLAGACKWWANSAGICCVEMLRSFGRVLKIELVRMPGRNIVGRTWPNDYNIMQHPQMLHEKFDHFQIWANNTQHVATCRNTSQRGSQCCDTLRWHVAIVWPGLKKTKSFPSYPTRTMKFHQLRNQLLWRQQSLNKNEWRTRKRKMSLGL